MNADLDETDLQILDLVREDGRANIRAIADHVGLPETTARDRLHRLERENYIRGYRALVDPRAVGMPVQAWVVMDAHDGDPIETGHAIWNDPCVLDGYTLTERPNGLAVRIAAADTQRLGRLLERWRNEHGLEVRDLLLLDDMHQQPVGLEDVEWEHAVLRTLKNTL